MPTLDIAMLPDEIGDARFDVAVAVDVLRATTTMAAMLDAGALGIVTAAGVEEARRLHAARPDSLLAGERGGVPPDGFDLGNSPLPGSVSLVRGRRVILTTTNGTGAVRCVENSGAEVLTMSLTNLPAVATRIAACGQDTLVVCSGTDGARSVEDELAAGLLADRFAGVLPMTERADRIRCDAVGLVERHGGVGGAVAASRHAARLDGLGFGSDVLFCSEVGATETVPVLNRGVGMFLPG